MAMTFTTPTLREIAEQSVGTGHERSMATAWLVEREQRDGYVTAFYRVAELIDIGAQPTSPAVVFETMILPRLREALAAETPFLGAIEKALDAAALYGRAHPFQVDASAPKNGQAWYRHRAELVRALVQR